MTFWTWSLIAIHKYSGSESGIPGGGVLLILGSCKGLLRLILNVFKGSEQLFQGCNPSESSTCTSLAPKNTVPAIKPENCWIKNLFWPLEFPRAWHYFLTTSQRMGDTVCKVIFHVKYVIRGRWMFSFCFIHSKVIWKFLNVSVGFWPYSALFHSRLTLQQSVAIKTLSNTEF